MNGHLKYRSLVGWGDDILPRISDNGLVPHNKPSQNSDWRVDLNLKVEVLSPLPFLPWKLISNS